jgi:hypothetical protein
MCRPVSAQGRLWWSMAPGVNAGGAAAAGGWSHSWVAPTTSSPAPLAKRISVALGESEAVRMLASTALEPCRAACLVLGAGSAGKPGILGCGQGQAGNAPPVFASP